MPTMPDQVPFLNTPYSPSGVGITVYLTRTTALYQLLETEQVENRNPNFKCVGVTRSWGRRILTWSPVLLPRRWSFQRPVLNRTPSHLDRKCTSGRVQTGTKRRQIGNTTEKNPLCAVLDSLVSQELQINRIKNENHSSQVQYKRKLLAGTVVTVKCFFLGVARSVLLAPTGVQIHRKTTNAAEKHKKFYGRYSHIQTKHSVFFTFVWTHKQHVCFFERTCLCDSKRGVSHGAPISCP